MRSVSSILSGVNPPRHGVASWRNQLTEPTLLDIPERASGFYNDAADRGGLSNILDRENKDTLEEIEPPFIYFERERGGHAPYDGYTYQEMIDEIEQSRPVLQRYYEEMICDSIDRFEKQLELLENRGVLENTLVIFLGDHGELLGERGLVSHSTPTVPELVYTPTVFIHPDITAGKRPQTIGHIDIAPTVLEAIGAVENSFRCDGVSLFDQNPGPRYNDAIHRIDIAGKEIDVYHSAGLWDGDGGHVFTTQGNLLAPVIGLRNALGWNRAYWRNNLSAIPTALWNIGAPYRRHGIPGFSKEEAKERVRKIRDITGSARQTQLSEEAEEQLRDLGYRT